MGTGVKDWLGTPSLAKQGIINGSLNLYVVSMQGMKNAYSGLDNDATVITIPPVDRIISCHFLPYIDYLDCQVKDVDYDEQAFPLPYNTDTSDVDNLTITRLLSLGNSGLKSVGIFNKYEIQGKSIGGSFKWQNEGKLWLYPFTQVIAYDNISEPFMINPLLINDENTNFEILCRNSLNHLGIYTLYVDNYRGSSQGQLYGQTVSGNSIPLVNNAYTSYMNENQFNIRNERFKTIVDLIGGITKDPLGSISNALFGYGDTYQGEINSQMAGYNLSNSGSEAIHDIQNFGGLTVAYQQPLEVDMNRMGLYFHQYGYAQNKIMVPNITSRHYWNYIKTQDVKIKIPNCPKNHLELLATIFNQGTTVWHLENGNMYESLNLDNYEE